MPRPATPLTMSFDAPELAEDARQCEAEAMAAGFDITREELDRAYDGFEDHSVFLTLADDTGRVHAAARFILAGPAGFPSMHEMRTYGWDADGHDLARAAGLDLARTWEVSTFSRRPDTPGGMRLALALSHGLIRSMQENETDAIVTIMNEQVRGYLAMSGLVYLTLPGAATLPYYGSPASTPVYAVLDDFVATARRLNPEGHRLVALGVGLDGISVPTAAGFHLRHTPRVIDLVAAEETARAERSTTPSVPADLR